MKSEALAKEKHSRKPFLVLLSAEAVSACGTQITLVALPLTAVTVLRGTPLDLAFVQAAAALPALIFGVAAGAMVEGLPKRRILIYANAVCAVVMALVPISAYFKTISIEVLMAVSFFGSTISLAERISMSAIIPEIVDRTDLAAANSRFGSVMATMRMVGPAIAGALVAAFSPPLAIVVDALSFLIASVLSMMLPEAALVSKSDKPREAIKDKLFGGFKELRQHSVLIDMFMVGSIANFVGALFGSLDTLFLVRQLKVAPSGFGFALAVCGVGAIVGSAVSGRLLKRYDLSALFNFAIILVIGGFIGICLLNGRPDIVFFLFCVCYFAFGFGGALVNTALVTHIQVKIPPESLSRVFGILISGFSILTPLGALFGGVLAEVIGIRQALVVGVIILTAVFLMALFKRHLLKRNLVGTRPQI